MRSGAGADPERADITPEKQLAGAEACYPRVIAKLRKIEVRSALNAELATAPGASYIAEEVHFIASGLAPGKGWWRCVDSNWPSSCSNPMAATTIRL